MLSGFSIPTFFPKTFTKKTSDCIGNTSSLCKSCSPQLSQINQNTNRPVDDDTVVGNSLSQETDSTEITSSDFQSIVKNSAVSFFSKLYANPSITRSSVQDIVQFTSDLFDSNLMSSLKQKILPLLQSDDERSEIDRMLTSIESPFHGLESEYLRFQYLEESKCLIYPIQYSLGESFVQNRQAASTSLEPSNAFGQFIPMRRVLQAFFQLPGVLKTCLEHMDNMENLEEPLFTLLQCGLWKSIKAKHAGKIIMPLLLYFDDYETGNPLGSAAGVHKLGAVYFTVASIPPQFLSSLENLFLALLFHSSDRIKFGNRATFNVLIKELIFLEQTGVKVETVEGSFDLYFALTLILGDNLGIHSILGLAESFGANYPCRICNVGKDVLKYQYSEDVSMLRTKISYEHDVVLNNVSLTGVKEACVWNDVPSFHLTSNISVDIMHDLLEGVCRYDMAEIMYHLIYIDKLFTLDTLNSRILFFNYSYLERGNIPPPIKEQNVKDKSIIMSASQMLCLVRYFGLMVGDLIPENNSVWNLYVSLRQIIDFVTCRSIQTQAISLLSTIISEHNELFVQLFDKHLKPKYHVLLHYPSVMRTIGPLINVWSMRYESKHKVFKNNARVVTCRKNLTHTLALKHQLILCNRLIDNRGLIDELEIGPKQSGICPPLLQNTSNVKEFICTSWVKYKGVEYKAGCVLITNLCNDIGLPSFAVVKSVYFDDQRNIYFYVQNFETTYFSVHLHAYNVLPCDRLTYYTLDDLCEITPTQIVAMADGKQFVGLRHAL